MSRALFDPRRFTIHLGSIVAWELADYLDVAVANATTDDEGWIPGSGCLVGHAGKKLIGSLEEMILRVVAERFAFFKWCLSMEIEL